MIFFANSDGSFHIFSTSTQWTQFITYGDPSSSGYTALFCWPIYQATSWQANPSSPQYLISGAGTAGDGAGGCLSTNGSTTSSSPLILENCTSSSAQQQFNIKFVQGLVRTVASNSSMCLDVSYDSTNSTASSVIMVVQNPCQNSVQPQKWVLNFQDKSLRSNFNTSMCLTASSGGLAGVLITLQICTGDSSQQWIPSQTGLL